MATSDAHAITTLLNLVDDKIMFLCSMNMNFLESPTWQLRAESSLPQVRLCNWPWQYRNLYNRKRKLPIIDSPAQVAKPQSQNLWLTFWLAGNEIQGDEQSWNQRNKLNKLETGQTIYPNTEWKKGASEEIGAYGCLSEEDKEHS